MASEKKYFPERKRQKKAGPQGDVEAEGEGDDGDGDEVAQTSTPGGEQVIDLLDFGGPAPGGGAQAQPTGSVTDLIDSAFGPGPSAQSGNPTDLLGIGGQ